MRLIFFFLKCLRLNVDFRNAVKNAEKLFSFFDNFILIDSFKFSLLPGKYFPSGVNVLTNGLQISDITKKEFFQLKYSQSDKES